jgi:DNA-binding MarR family transcriptional regulator
VTVADEELARYGRQLTLLARVIEATLGDLSLTGYRVLALVEQGDHRSSEIARQLAVGRPTVTYAVDTLVDKGLLERETAESDRRVIQLRLTRAGREALRRADRAITARLRPVFEHIEDPDAALRTLHQVHDATVATRAEWLRLVAARHKKRRST